MQFTGHPLPVHQFVTVLWNFNPVPYYQPSSPAKSLPITGQWNMQLLPSLERHVWPGRRSIYINRTLSGSTTPGLSGPESYGNERELCIGQSSSITEASPSGCFVSYLGYSFIGRLLLSRETGGVLKFCIRFTNCVYFIELHIANMCEVLDNAFPNSVKVRFQS